MPDSRVHVNWGALTRFGAIVGCCVALLISGCAAQPRTTAAAAATGHLPALGVNIDLDAMPPAQRRREFARLATMGATWIRTGARWDELQPDSDTTDRSALTRLEEIITDAAAAGLHVLLVGDWAPNWAGGSGNTAAMPSAYGNYLGQVAERLHSRGPQGSSPAYELMNEPDNISSGTPWADPVDYAHAACAAFRQIKRHDPSASVIAGALDVTEWRPWLLAAFRAGLGGCFDALSAHPYPGLPVLDEIRSFAAGHGVPDSPIWATEFGASTCGSVLEGCSSDTEQAQSLVATLTQAGEHYPWVPVAFIYSDRDQPQQPGGPAEQAFGIFRADMSEKSAVSAITTLYRERHR